MRDRGSNKQRSRRDSTMRSCSSRREKCQASRWGLRRNAYTLQMLLRARRRTNMSVLGLVGKYRRQRWKAHLLNFNLAVPSRCWICTSNLVLRVIFIYFWIFFWKIFLFSILLCDARWGKTLDGDRDAATKRCRDAHSPAHLHTHKSHALQHKDTDVAS